MACSRAGSKVVGKVVGKVERKAGEKAVEKAVLTAGEKVVLTAVGWVESWGLASVVSLGKH